MKVTYPLGGEKLIQGSLERIHWDAFGNIGTFDVSYSTNNGSTWTTIASGLSATTRAIDWTLPAGIISANCLVRVVRGAENDQSDETFNIHGVPTNLSAVATALDSAEISWTAYAGATTYNVYQLGVEKMELIGSTAGTTMEIGGLTAGQDYWFSVSANTLPTEGQRAIAINYGHDVNGVCSGCLFNASLPYSESFESGNGDHCNFGGDDFDWAVISGSTPSTGTGPSSAQDGSQYIYVEATSPNFPAQNTILGGPCFDMSGCTNAYVAFYYHMYGAGMGTLSMEITTNQGGTWSSPIWSVSGDQGDVWHMALVDLSAYCGGDFAYRFNATIGTDFTSDMAIDNIFILEGILCFPPGNPQVVSLDETEARISWLPSSGAVTYELELVDISASETFTGIPTETGVTDTTYLYTGLTSLNNYDVYVRSICSGGDSSDWIGPVSFATLGCVPGLPWTDDFESYSTCSTAGGPEVCNFGGGWIQDSGDGNDWRIHAGPTSSVETGPDVDNTLGTALGQYAYIEASSTFNLISNLITPCIDLDLIDTAELEFFYHMYGADMGTLNVDITSNGGGTWTNLWTQSGQVQTSTADAWLPAIIDLSAYSGVVQFRFQGIAGASFNSDMAIDDVSVRELSSCGPVSGVNIHSITDSSAQVGWLDFANRDDVDIELVNLTLGGSFMGIPTYTGITDTTYLLSGLDEATEYSVYLRGNCGSDSSSWSGPFTFFTDCVNYLGNTFANPIIVPALPYADTNNTAVPCVTNDYVGQESNDLIYQLTTGPGADSLLVSTCTAISDFDTYVYLLDSALAIVGFNDDDPTGTCSYLLGGANRFSILYADVDPNTTYYVVVDGWSTSSQGNYAVEIEELGACASSLTINGTPASGTYSASGLITSDALIQNPNIVIFNGGLGVDLQNSFEVELGAEFEANNDGCP